MPESSKFPQYQMLCGKKQERQVWAPFPRASELYASGAMIVELGSLAVEKNGVTRLITPEEKQQIIDVAADLIEPI